MPIFGAAYAAPNKGTTNLFWFRSLSTVLSPTENSRNEGLSRPFSDIPVLFKADLIFKDFSRKPSKFKYFSSLCEPCINQVILYWPSYRSLVSCIVSLPWPWTNKAKHGPVTGPIWNHLVNNISLLSYQAQFAVKCDSSPRLHSNSLDEKWVKWKKVNKQCLLDTPRTVRKSEKLCFDKW